MSEEIKNNSTASQQELMKQFDNASELYVLISMCTREPYVVCDPETFDDEVMLFSSEEDAREECKALIGEKIPVNIAKVDKKHMKEFYMNLCTMGVNALLVKNKEAKQIIQLSNFIRRTDLNKTPDGKLWVENPELHLTSIYYVQELRRPAEKRDEEKMKELQEEITADFRKGRYIFAVQKEENGGTPMIKLQDGNVYQPVFSDILEFQKFNQGDKLRPVIVEADKIMKVLAPDTKGVILNPMSENMTLTLKH